MLSHSKFKVVNEREYTQRYLHSKPGSGQSGLDVTEFSVVSAYTPIQGYIFFYLLK